MEQIRLQKYLADAGIASRRKAEELIKQGKVYVNGKIYYGATNIGYNPTVNGDNLSITTSIRKYGSLSHAYSSYFVL